MRLLVTGNCGFIGQNFVRLLGDNHEIIGFDKLDYASDKLAANLCPTFIGDLANKNHVEEVFRRYEFDAIINFAACSHVDNSIKSPEPFIYSNYVGTFNLLEAARKHNVWRYLQVSTDEVAGDLQPNDPPFSDVNILKPSSPYSASKASADLLVLAYHRTYGMRTIITRSCNNYGPYQYKEKLLPIVILNAINDKPIPVYGTGENMREWIHVLDNCEAIELALINGKPGKVYHIGSGVEYKNIELIKKILSIMGKPESLITFVEDRKGHDLRYALDCTELKKIHWSGGIMSIDRGLEDTIEWYMENQNYWEQL